MTREEDRWVTEHMEIAEGVAKRFQQRLGDDATSIAYAKLCEMAKHRDHESWGDAYIGRAIKNVLSAGAKSAGKQRGNLAEVDETADNTSNPEDQLLAREELGMLSAEDLEIMRALYMEGLTQEEVAERLGVSTRQIGRRVENARVKLGLGVDSDANGDGKRAAVLKEGGDTFAEWCREQGIPVLTPGELAEMEKKYAEEIQADAEKRWGEVSRSGDIEAAARERLGFDLETIREKLKGFGSAKGAETELRRLLDGASSDARDEYAFRHGMTPDYGPSFPDYKETLQSFGVLIDSLPFTERAIRTWDLFSYLDFEDITFVELLDPAYWVALRWLEKNTAAVNTAAKKDGRKKRQEEWLDSAVKIATKIRGEHPKMTQDRLIKQVSEELKKVSEDPKKKGITKSPSTIRKGLKPKRPDLLKPQK